FDVTGTSQDLQTGGDAMASFLTGIGPVNGCDNDGVTCNYEVPNFVSTQSIRFAHFAQDNFRVTKNLTFSAGLRYELSLPRTERHNRMNWLDPNLISPLQVPGLPQLHGGEVFADQHHRN